MVEVQSLLSRGGTCLRRHISTRKSKKVNFDDLPEELRSVMYGRRSRERADSLTPQMLQDRLQHMTKIKEVRVSKSLVLDLIKIGHGKKTRLSSVYSRVKPTAENWRSKTAPRTTTGAGLNVDSSVDSCSLTIDLGGYGVLVGSAVGNWPIFKHLLPEVSFAGHSNSGKVIPSTNLALVISFFSQRL
jgi:hypothetical protein